MGVGGKPPAPFSGKSTIMTHSKDKAGWRAKGRVAVGRMIIASLLLITAIGVMIWRSSGPPVAKDATERVVKRDPVKHGDNSVLHADRAAPAPPVGPEVGVEPADPVPSAPASEASRRMIRSVWDIQGTEPLSAAQAAAWLKNLDEVTKAGAASVPAIAEFLKLAENTFFSPENKQLLGVGSVREALLDALAEIGGPEAIAVMARELATTASPREVAMLASSLEGAAPGRYRDQAVSAARESLAMAVEGDLESFDVAPLFEVLQLFGGVEVLADLESAARHWGQYATLALGDLPDGAGIPALLRIADVSPNGSPNAARLESLQIIAQLASSNDEARTSLLALARAERLPAHVWPYLARPLSGEHARLENTMLDTRAAMPEDKRTGTVHVAGGNQNLVWGRSEGEISPAEIQRQRSLVDELALVTRDPDGQRVLEQVRALIEQQAAQSRLASPPSK
jgi:hypothetical protein